MAAGKQHFKNNIKLCVVLMSIYVLYAHFIMFYIGPDVITILLGFVLGIFITPDIDIPGKTYTEYMIESVCKKVIPSSFGITIGWTLKQVYFIITYPIGWAFPHRSFWTHFPIIGTIVKVCYFTIIYSIITWSIPFWIWSIVFIKVFIPWILLDIQHFFDDGCMYIGIDGNKKYLFGYNFYERIRKRNANALSKASRH